MFDTTLADRIRKRVAPRKGFSEKQMFEGIAFLLNGNMCCGVHGKDMIVRLDPAATEKALVSRHTKPFDLTGRPMKGWLLVEPKGLVKDTELNKWIHLGVGFAESLPAKQK